VTRKAAFLDRDGTIMEDRCYVASPDDVVFLDGAFDGLRALRDRGFRLVIVSNQSGIARGLVTPDQAAAVHDRFLRELRGRGLDVDGAFYCPHGPEEGCDCRKPAPGLVLRAAAALDLDPGASIAIGDRWRDLEAARSAGCPTTVLLGAADGEQDASATAVLEGWREFLEWLEAR
jgi:D-glycero-D-manno-heptose 1,7-bisphosphate phosphatase